MRSRTKHFLVCFLNPEDEKPGGILHWLWTPASKHEIGLKNLMPSGALNKKKLRVNNLSYAKIIIFVLLLSWIFFSTIWLSINQSYFLMFWSWDVWHAMGTLDIFLCQFSVKWNKGGLLRLKSETTFLLSNLQKLTTKFHLIVLQIILGLNIFLITVWIIHTTRTCRTSVTK